MKKIKLSQGKYALVDDKDFLELNVFKWYTLKRGKNFYAARNSRVAEVKGRLILMHRFIMQTPNDMQTDHRDGNGLNNQRKNLRVCTVSQNQMNRGIQSNSTSGLKGVSYTKQNKKWKAQILINKKHIYLGYFDTKELAYQAYVTACKKYHKEFAKV